MSSFCICKSYSHFVFSKNTCELDILLTRTIAIWPLTSSLSYDALNNWALVIWRSKDKQVYHFQFGRNIKLAFIWNQNMCITIIWVSLFIRVYMYHLYICANVMLSWSYIFPYIPFCFYLHCTLIISNTQINYNRASMAWISLGPRKFVRKTGRSNHGARSGSKWRYFREFLFSIFHTIIGMLSIFFRIASMRRF